MRGGASNSATVWYYRSSGYRNVKGLEITAENRGFRLNGVQRGGSWFNVSVYSRHGYRRGVAFNTIGNTAFGFRSV